MEMEPWNSDDWQGRSEEQIKNGYAVMRLTLVCSGIALIIASIISLI